MLRPKDPLPINGLQAREIACKGIQVLAQQIGGKTPDLNSRLPTSLFPETGNGLKRVQRLARGVCGLLYVRIVDKGAGHVWGFRRV